ncbi:ROK family protein [Halobellus limi]|jgi:glucokinase|uniref:Glucokinase n=1 Tax=Halobellus limi TaxID=699433 RepID=A0A1H5W4V6_9EURY|nr:ROK family protein [Halobellus limi]QCC46540.1 ROK family protein [Halobellus limi]SEF94191.1 glucokinase [Halobellus limi]
MAYYVGVDLGATNVRAVVADDDGTVIGRSDRGTPRGPTGITVTEAVLRVAREACAEGGVDPEQVNAAGIGAIGPLDLAEGTVENPANLPDTIDRIPLTGPLSVLFDTERVYLHNDTNAGVIGERFYSDRNPDDMVYLTISSGIGAGVCVDGNVLSGWDGNAGEVGHMTVDPQGLLTCGCGHDGHWEAYCSGNNIPRYAEFLFEEDDIETALPIEDPEFSAVDVFEHDGTDEFATHVVEQLAHWNAMGVANIVHAYAPLIVYVGGAVALNNPERTLDPIRERMDEMVMSNVPEIQLTTLGDDVVVKGALASAMTDGTGDRTRL